MVVAKLVASLDGASETSIQGLQTGRETVYKRGKDGLYSVDNPDHIAAMKQMGFRESTGIVRVGGYPCKCGFASFFRKCSRCGSEN